MILGIVGSRYATSSKYDEFAYLIRRYIYQHEKPRLIITGDTNMIHAMTKQFAQEHGIKCTTYDDQPLTGKLSIHRNQKIIDKCTHLIVMPSCVKDSPDAWLIIYMAREHQKDISILYM